jgi:hypothetical protein
LLAGDHSRGSGSPEMADLGLPDPISDGIRPRRMLATRVIHLDGWRRSAGLQRLTPRHGRLGSAELASVLAFPCLRWPTIHDS